MTKDDKSLEEIFDESVKKVFQFLIDEHGFSLIKDSQASYTARTKDCEICISYDLPLSIFIQIKPPYYYKPYLDLREIVRFYDSNYNTLPNAIKAEEVAAEMESLASLLIKHCSPMLKGDLTEWHKIDSKR